MAKTAAKEKNLREPFNPKKEARLLPGYLVLAFWVVFTAIVVGWIVLASLSTTKEIFSNSLLDSGLHFENYVKAWTTGKVSMYFLNSMIYTFTSLAGILLIAAPCSYVLSRFKFFASGVITRAFVMALSIPAIMIVLPLYAQAVQWNLLNSRLTLIVIYICFNVPFCTFFLLNHFATLSSTFEEAAAIDGCGPGKTFFRIMLPLAQPGLITVGIFLFVQIWNEYFIALIFANGAELRPLGVGLFSIVQSMKYTGDWAGLFAAVVIVFLPTFILYLFLSQKIIAGITGGGVKG